MISTPARGADRVVGAGPPLRALSATTALVMLLLGGLVLRLTIAYILFPASGFESDVSTYVSWAMTMAEHGPGGFYASAGFTDYPPGYMYLLWPIGLLANAFGGDDPFATVGALVKVPPMLIDTAVGYALYRLVLGWAWPGRRAEALALGAAALYVFNPVTFYDSALWGQTDAAGALIILLGVAALVRGNSEGAAFLGTLAALIKPQFGVVLIPLVAVLLLRRHLFRPGSGPRRSPWGPARLRGWLAREQGPIRLVTSGIVALVTFFVLALPFGMGIAEYLTLMRDTAGGYAYLTVNAFNPWALFGAGGDPSLAASAMTSWSVDTVPFLGPVPGVVIGAALLVAGFLYALINQLVRDERRTIVVTATFLCICFFVLPTRVHERYLVPVFALLPILAVTSRAWLVALVALTVGCLVNLHGVLTVSVYGTENIVGLPLGEESRSFLFIVGAVVLVTGGFVFSAWRLWRGAAHEPDGLALAARQLQGHVDLGPVPTTARSVQRSGPAAASGTGPGYPDDDVARWASAAEVSEIDTGLVRGPSVLEWIHHRITSRPLRRDRSASLAGERPGRLDRLDLLLVAVIAVSAGSLRGYRADQPYDMYFDEVYHARTAMEFLQEWRYDQPHGIYEWTHPHLAKYAMALGIETLGDHRVTGRSELGVPVRGAVSEPRWSPSDRPGERDGDRLYVTTGTDLAVFDLADRTQVASIPSDATALVIDPDAHLLYLTGPTSAIETLDTTLLDEARRDRSAPVPEPQRTGSVTGIAAPTAVALTSTADPGAAFLVTLGADGSLTAFDAETGEQVARRVITGAVDVEALPGRDQALVRPAEIEDIVSTAEVIAEDLGEDPLDIEDELAEAVDSGAEEVSLGVWLDDDAADALRVHIDDGTLVGVSVENAPVVAVATDTGVAFVGATTLSELHEVPVTGGVTGLAFANDAPGDEAVFAAGPVADDDPAGPSGGGLVRIRLVDDKGNPVQPSAARTIRMPGPVSRVVWNDVAQLLHVQGVTRDEEPTVYLVDPHGDSVFMDVPVPFEPTAIVADLQPDRPSVDRTQLLVMDAGGATASIDIGGNAWGYRMPGVLMGALTAVCLYLLGRLLFRRRSVALFAAALALAEGMLFANSRIAMNDVYVTGFLVVALTLFAPVWMGTWRRPWQIALVLPVVGVLLGLALASKWVAAYAMGGMVLLVLLRSGLGRVIALAGMLGLTAVLGTLAVRPAQGDRTHENWPFLVIMALLTLALAAAMVRRPVRITRAEVGSAVVWLVVGGIVVLVAGVVLGPGLDEDGWLTARNLILAGAGAILGAGVLGSGSLILGRLGRGPFAVREDGAVPEPLVDGAGWLSPGRLLAVPWLLGIACLIVLPVGVYVLSYTPWVDMGNRFWDGAPAGNGGQTLWDMTLQMYRYHDELRVPHAASSPWWAWPLNLKPVWFYQESFADDTSGGIYDSGNLLVFWMGIGAMLFAGIAAWRRRSLPLTLIVLLFAAMWLPWARIDRATFQYHYYTALPFLVLSLAYLLAELWHGPARLAWLITRITAALCILGPALLWLFRQPLCVIADTQAVNAGSEACGAASRTVQVSDQALVALLVLGIGCAVAAWQIWRGSRADPVSRAPEREAAGTGSRWRYLRAHLADGPMGGVVVTAGATLLGILASIALLSDEPTITLLVGANELSVLALLLLAGPAWLVLRARDARRFAAGIVGAVALFLLVWYPNLTGLPLPTGLAYSFQGLLPTWNYSFQFGVNQADSAEGSLIDAGTIIVAGVTLVGIIGVMLIARRWRSRPEPVHHAVLDSYPTD